MKRKKPLVTPEDLEKFEDFLFEMDDVLEAFLADAASSGYTLDYSVPSLDAMEQFLLANAGSSDLSRIENRAARYLGEVFRKKFGGTWQLCQDEPRHICFKLPIIKGYLSNGAEFCPIAIINNFMFSRRLGLCRNLLVYQEDVIHQLRNPQQT